MDRKYGKGERNGGDKKEWLVREGCRVREEEVGRRRRRKKNSG